MTTYFPLYARLVGRRCVVVGGGQVAERKTADLLAAGAIIRVISPNVTARLQSQAEAGKIEWLPTPYEIAHLNGAWLVFAATNDRAINAQIAHDADAQRIWANIADAPEEGDFVVPSVVRRGDLCLSVSTGGASPMLARKVAAELDALYGAEYGLLTELLGQMRAAIKTRTKFPAQRRAALAQLVVQEAELRDFIRAGDFNQARQRAETIAASVLAAGEEAVSSDSLSESG